MAVRMDGKALADKICQELKIKCDELKKCDTFPRLTIVTSGDDSASKVYVRNKIKRCEEIGIECDVRHFDSLDYNKFNEIMLRITNPIIIQEPITGYVDHKAVSMLMPPTIDVDGFSYKNMGNLAMGYEPYYYPCTPMGVMELLKEYNIELEGKNVLIIGRSNIVGRPMAMMLEHAGCTVTIAHSKTPQKELYSLFWRNDIIASAVGKRNVFETTMTNWPTTSNMLSNKIIIDVGMNRDENGKLCGDISEELKQLCAYYTPTPGSTGPMTVAMLMKNTIKFYKNCA